MIETRFIAKWESCSHVLLALPDESTDWDYVLPEAQEQFVRLIRTLTDNGEHCIVLCHDRAGAESLLCDCNSDLLMIVEAPYNDTWTRDYGPITVIRGERTRSLDFGFNGWGLKFAADKDNLVNLFLHDNLVLDPERYRNVRDFILEGGSVETDGQGTLLTTSRCLLSPNRNGGKSKKEIGERLRDVLGVEHILWLDHGALEGDDTDSHIDTLCRMAPDNVILFTGCRNMDDPQFEELLKMRAQLSLFRNMEGESYNLVELPLPDPIFDSEGNRLPATYANYLVTERNLFMPVYNQPANDLLACQTVRIAFPNHNIIPVDCRTLLLQHGSLHCSTMQIP